MSGYLAFVEVCAGPACWRPRSLEWEIVAVNLLGCIAFGISAIASFVVPSTGSVMDLAAANVTTAFGGANAGYTLTLLVREITSTSLRLDAATIAPGTSVVVRPVVAKASSGFVSIQVDRFDPLTGWQFNRLLRVRVGGSANWQPPAEGRWLGFPAEWAPAAG